MGFNPKIRKEISWLKLGKWDKTSFILMVAVIIFASTALILWYKLLKPDISDFKAMFSNMPASSMIASALFFSLTNAFAEEVLFRGMIRDGLLVYCKPIMEVLITSALFALIHIQGFPRGVVGIIMVFIWGISLAIMRNRTKGMLFPYITHVFADLTIFFILFFVV